MQKPSLYVTERRRAGEVASVRSAIQQAVSAWLAKVLLP